MPVAKQGLLGGLKSDRKSAAGQLAYGRSMANDADLGLAKEKMDAQYGANKFQSDQDIRMKKASQSADQQRANIGLQSQKEGLDSRKSVFDTNMDFAYAQMRKQQRVNLRQALLNQVGRHFS